MILQMATKDFGKDEVLALRKALGLNQTEFAEKLGVNQTAVSHWETGHRKPSGPACVLMEQLEAKILKKNRA
jgi:DNA-binding transcriptional regulator YiaG